MIESKFPRLDPSEREELLAKARSSKRLRFPKILHKKGDYFNHVYNFIAKGSYMQPHLHPGDEKIENIHLVSGRVVVLYFDDSGNMTDTFLLDELSRTHIEVPSFTWHTYVSLEDTSITYETMNGVYEPTSWKRYANWAPKEDDKDSVNYLSKIELLANQSEKTNP